MPYLEVQKQESEESIIEDVTMPNITGLTIKEAEKQVKELSLEIKIEEEGVDKEKTIIKDQTPKEGIKVNKGSKIIIKY